MSTRWGLALLLLCACHRAPRGGFVARGSVVFSPKLIAAAPGAAQIDALLATEIEVLRSSRLLQRAAERVGKVERGQVSVARRPGSLVLDVTVSDGDGQRAAALCNQLLRAYAEQRLEQRQMVLEQQIRALEDQPEKVKQLELERRSYENDVRVLEECRPFRL